MASKKSILFILLTLSTLHYTNTQTVSTTGHWKLLKKSIGISAMHMQLMPNDKLIAFDRTDSGVSNISLPDHRCRRDPHDQTATVDCSAHSVEFEPKGRNVRPLNILTDTWCSSGALSPNGTLTQSGGFNDGDRVVRYFSPCDACDWVEDPTGLAVRRWYASSQILPDGRIIIVGGRKQFNYEFIPKRSKQGYNVYNLPFLRETRDDTSENNLYPFIHLSIDGNLFIFANNRSILLDYVKNVVVKRFPDMPGGVARNYPSSGSSVLLPIKLDVSATAAEAEVMICGGAPAYANRMANASVFVPAARSCGRLRITDASPEWEMEEMPIERVMGDMILLPTGDVLIINGAKRGSAGWGAAREPVLTPVIYRTSDRSFEVLSPAGVPRVYHSTAHLLQDGRVVVGGSNTNVRYNFTNVLFPTELSVEAFYPPYMEGKQMNRPRILSVDPADEMGQMSSFAVEFDLRGPINQSELYVTLVAPSFTTHSFSMNQRLLVLNTGRVHRRLEGRYAVGGLAPASAAVAPPGYYLMFVVHRGVPSRGKWVHVFMNNGVDGTI
ncbi:hypothetical protein QJS04_geneDACA016286 [Acorus gramineus]|uniref:Galactose oxidase n=1 Tax=Acorus gramineus TaxID=55184 RepID=A0AAV9A1Y7_ACOGR|nr:hypothetical protein QJS04_geneDACA016286 [Acorus gramineus]